ncbi:MAG: hypothetical protein SPJ27_04115 [Candidatus Onthovivens sp.]|nr:hypothetical protein [Candidatus Onthovivens sp.]
MINKLNKWDLNCSAFNSYDFDDCMSLNELLCRFFTKINECIDVSNEALTYVEWLKTIGLKNEVVELLTEWKDDGTLADLIGEQIVSEINQKISNNQSKIESLENKDIIHENNINNIKSEISNLKSKDSQLDSEIEALTTFNRYQVKSKFFTLKNSGDEIRPDPLFSDELLITEKVETYWVQVTYTNPFSNCFKGSVLAQSFGVGNKSNINVVVKDVNEYGFKFGIVSGGSLVNNSEITSSSYTTYISFIHLTKLKRTLTLDIERE